jgi:membrane-bound serine protease (ClpP class)
LQEGWLMPPPRSTKPPPLPEQITKAYVIPIHGVISETTYDAVKRKALLRCKAKGAEIIIFDMDTPGGDSRGMNNIVRLMVKDLADVYTVAHVNPQAYSAGAIIALACDEIVFSPLGRFGDAMPIFVSGGSIVSIPEKIRGKFESADRTDARVLAERNGYDVLLCEAMITITMELWLVRNAGTGELKIVEAENWRNKVRNPPGTRKRPRPAELSEWEFLDVVDGPDELVSLTANEALKWGFTRQIFPTTADMYRHYHIAAEPTVLEDTWSEGLVELLTSPMVTGILMFVLVLGIYVELNTPGVGLPGAVALIALAILLGSRYLTGLAQWWEIALFVLGLLLLAVEIFITPGFGVLGTLGLIFCAVGLLAMIVPNPPDELPVPTTQFGWRVFKTSLLALTLSFVGAVVAAAVVARFLPKMPIASRLVLAPVRPTGGPASESAPIRSITVGQTGTVVSICRPVGQVRFADKLVDAVADGAFIPAGRKVRVVKNEGNRVVVTPTDA